MSRRRSILASARRRNAAPVLLVRDDFTGTAGTLNGRTPDDVNLPGNTWATLGGSYSVDGSGNATCAGGTGPYYNIAAIECGESDGEAIVTSVYGSSSSIGASVFVRASNLNNGWYVRVQRSGSALEIIERNGGTETVRSSVAITVGTGHSVTVRAVLSGNTITAYALNNNTSVEVSTSYTSSFNAAATLHGIHSRGGSFVTAQTEFFFYGP